MNSTQSGSFNDENLSDAEVSSAAWLRMIGLSQTIVRQGNRPRACVSTVLNESCPATVRLPNRA